MGLLDDEEFSKNWAQSRANKGKGEYIVTRELRLKGVSEININNAVDFVESDEWQRSARRQANKKMRKFSNLKDYQRKHKIKQYLYQRGFSPDTIDAVIDDLAVEGVE